MVGITPFTQVEIFDMERVPEKPQPSWKLGRCTGSSGLRSHTDVAFVWPTAGLAEMGCPLCGEPLQQTTRFLRAGFTRVESGTSLFQIMQRLGLAGAVDDVERVLRAARERYEWQDRMIADANFVTRPVMGWVDGEYVETGASTRSVFMPEHRDDPYRTTWPVMSEEERAGRLSKLEKKRDRLARKLEQAGGALKVVRTPEGFRLVAPTDDENVDLSIDVEGPPVSVERTLPAGAVVIQRAREAGCTFAPGATYGEELRQAEAYLARQVVTEASAIKRGATHRQPRR